MKQIERFFEISNKIEGVTSNWEVEKSLTSFENEDSLLIFHNNMGYLNAYCIAGEYRDYDVWVGGKQGLSPVDIEFAMKELFKWKNLDSWEKIKEWHILFEQVHPFGDGNGRAGRYLMALQCKRAGCLREMYNTFNRGSNRAFEEMRKKYYSWFN